MLLVSVCWTSTIELVQNSASPPPPAHELSSTRPCHDFNASETSNCGRLVDSFQSFVLVHLYSRAWVGEEEVRIESGVSESELRWVHDGRWVNSYLA